MRAIKNINSVLTNTEPYTLMVKTKTLEPGVANELVVISRQIINAHH